ncbi:MAG: hypothetical protein GY854_32095 [Deltaproteobacteria bacterium]|nr:hypothetical protein [Deltaproteobacteria bacterium]
MTYARYLEAERVINEGMIRLGLSLMREEIKPKDPEARMAEMRGFLEECGNPQKGIPAVHVGGTSGKGSVCSAIAGILTEAGLKVGLHVSPYLQSATEKIWVADRFVSSDAFADLVDWVTPVALPRVHPDTPASIHGMASVAIALEAFRLEKVDVMVFEVGCGGRFDLTSFVDTAVAVVTNVGMDHVVSLGPTIENIAWHKAGIARPSVPLVTGATGDALGPIREEASRVDAPLIEIPSRIAGYAHNHAVAEEASRWVARVLGVSLGKEQITRGLERVRLAGRSEIMPGDGPRVVLDGAHNAEKLAVAIDAALTGAGPGQRIGVVGFLGTKAKPELVKSLEGRFDHIIATEPNVYAKTSCPTTETAALLTDIGYDATIEPDMFAAVDAAIDRAGADGTVLVTGSFYLVGDIRERWFSKESVVMQQTSWPDPAI